MSPARRAIALGILLTASAVHGSLAAPALVMTPCELEHPLRLSVLPAECGVLRVPENPHQPDGRQIGLRIARVSAISRRKQPDPLFVLAGGPGAAAGAFYVTVAGPTGCATGTTPSRITLRVRASKWRRYCWATRVP